MEQYWWLALLLVAGGLVYGGVRMVGLRLRGLSNAAFGVDSLIEGLRLQRERLETTPKSVSAMTRLCLPQIQADFPEFSYEEFVQRGENLLCATLLSIDAGRLEGLGEAAESYRRQVSLRLEQNASSGIEEHFSSISVHETQIARYVKEQGRCAVLLQLAVGHLHYRERDGEVLSGSRERLEQTKYELELLYIQDVDQMPEQTGGVGLTCPNCGAPVKNLGEKRCEYCGAALRELNLRVWAFSRFSEVK